MKLGRITKLTELDNSGCEPSPKSHLLQSTEHAQIETRLEI